MEAGEYGERAGGGELGLGEAPGGDADRARADGEGSCDVERGIADDDGIGGVRVDADGVGEGLDAGADDVDTLGVVVAEAAGGDVPRGRSG